MRNIIPLFLILLFVFNSCKKTGTSPNPNPGGGSGGNGAITITAISPLNPYQGDIVTLTGTGFDPDKTKDTVYIYNSNGPEAGVANKNTTIISATATEIKFRTDSSMTIYGAPADRFSFYVGVPSKSFISGDTLNLKSLPVISHITSYDPYTRPCNGYETWAGDSLFIEGTGLYPPLTISIDGKQVDYVGNIPLQNWDWTRISKPAAFIGIDFFGTQTPTGNCQTNEQIKEVKVVNADGRIAVHSNSFFPGPNSTITEITMDQSTYSRSAGTNAILNMKGYAVRNFTLFVTGVDQASLTTFSETLSSYGGDLTGPFTTTIDLLGLPDPTSNLGAYYETQVKDANGNVIGGVHFTLYK